MTLKICHVGCGTLSSRYYGPSYATYLELHEETELVACCDLNENLAKLFSAMLGFKRYHTRLDEMLKIECPDVVVIVVPEDKIAPIATRIMDAGFPVIMEKPPGITLPEFRKLHEKAKQNDIPNQVNFNRRFTPILQKLRSILSIKVDNDDNIDYLRYDFWRVQRRERDFYTTAIHGIDAVRYILNTDYENSNLTYQAVSELGDEIYNIFIDATMKSGTQVHLNFIVNSGIMVERALVQLGNETVFCNIPVWGSIDTPGSIIIYKNGKQIQEIKGDSLLQGIDEPEEPHFMGFYEELRSGFEAIRANQPTLCDLGKCKQSMEIAEAIRERKNNLMFD